MKGKLVKQILFCNAAVAESTVMQQRHKSVLSKLNGDKRNGKFFSTQQIEGSLDLGGREGRERRERREERWVKRSGAKERGQKYRKKDQKEK